MATSIVHPDRIRWRTDRREPADGDRVVYWMQRAQRAEHNDALEHAVRAANDIGVPLLVVVALVPGYPDASRRHHRFLLEGLSATARALGRRNIGFVARSGPPDEVVPELASSACLLVGDRAYQRHLVSWREQVAAAVSCPVVEVETDVIVPVEVASDHREYAARTLRPDLHEVLDRYAVALTTSSVDHHHHDGGDGFDLDDVGRVLDDLGVNGRDDDDRHVELRGGTSRARTHLRRFLEEDLAGYGDRRPDPVRPRTSRLSPYLHFGQISPVAVLLAVRAADAPRSDREAFVEELLVRRELAVNFVHHEPDYDRFSALPEWARTTLEEHRDDERPVRYTARELEEGRTHDPYWNAAMAEIRETGYLHNHLRMYWGKRVIEWTNTPEHAFRTLLDLNNRYFLDGRDCSSYANVGWVFGLHDRAFAEREVTGKLRPMTPDGLARKLDVDAWLADVRARLGDAAVDGPDGSARD